MQITIKNRETLTGDSVTVLSQPIDVSGMPQCAINETIHSVGGTVTAFDINFQASGNLEDWVDIGPTLNGIAVGVELEELNVRDDKYGRYVRAQIILGGTGTALVNYSLWLDTYSSS